MNLENPFEVPKSDPRAPSLNHNQPERVHAVLWYLGTIGCAIGSFGAFGYSLRAFDRGDYFWTIISLAIGSAIFVVGYWIVRR